MSFWIALVSLTGVLVLWRKAWAVFRQTEESQQLLARESRFHDGLAAQVDKLRTRVELLERGIKLEPEPAPAPAPNPVAYAEAFSEPLAATAMAGVETTHVAPPPFRATEPKFAAPLLDETAGEAAKTAGGWEALIGGSVLNKIGALVLVVGLALFLSYSFARMGPGGRVATGAALGLILLVTGILAERLARYRNFSRGLMAAGWASLYFVSYAMHALPAARIIASPTLGAALMMAVALGITVHSLRYRSQSLTTVAYASIFAALALSELSFHSVICLLPIAASALYLSRRLAWDGLPLFCMAATYLTFFSRALTAAAGVGPRGEVILLLFWILFEASGLLAMTRKGKGRASLIHVGFAWNAICGIAFSVFFWNLRSPATLWQLFIAAGACYLVSAIIRFRLGPESLAEYALAISSLFFGLAIFARVDGIWTGLAYTTEAEILFLVCLLLRNRWAKFLSILGFAASILSLAGLKGQSVLYGAPIDRWAVPLAVIAAIFYVNRALSPKDRYFSYAASVFVTLIAGSEIRGNLVGPVLLAFATLLFEFGFRLRCEDLRYQAYGTGILGVFGCMLPFAFGFQAQNGIYAIGVALCLAAAIRAVRSLANLSEKEKAWLRHGGSICGTALASTIILRAAGNGYGGAMLIAASLLFFELALRGLPLELRRPACAMNVLGFAVLLAEHASELQKHPSQSVWLSFAAASAAYYVLAVRFGLAKDSGTVPAGVAPWAGSICAAAAGYVLLPDAYFVPALAVFAYFHWEAGLFLESANLKSHGRLVSLLGAPLLLLLDGRYARVSDCLMVAGIQWLIWFRGLEEDAAEVHGWLAAAVIGYLIPWQFHGSALALWAVFAAALATLGKTLKVRPLHRQATAICALAGGFAIFEHFNLWQIGVLVAAFGVSLVLERRDEEGGMARSAYGIAIALLMALTSYREVSGGMLTLSWAGSGIVLLAAGFLLYERALRLSGLVILLACIARVFFWDLRMLETVYRILSFIGLGLILILVSWIYTRFREQVEKLL